MVEGEPRGLESITAFTQGLAELGWTVGGQPELGRQKRWSLSLAAPEIAAVWADCESCGLQAGD
jgi:hypothetical protein